MNTPIELIPLNCIQCGTSLPADPDEVAWECAQCGQGMRLDAQTGLTPLEIRYAAGIQPNQKGRPFWVCEGRVTIQRDTYSLRDKDGDAEEFWRQARRFFIPAFDFPLDSITQLGVQWLKSPPDLPPGPVQPFQAVTVFAADVQAWAEFLVLAMEAERKDKIKSLGYSLKLGEPELWILP